MTYRPSKSITDPYQARACALASARAACSVTGLRRGTRKSRSNSVNVSSQASKNASRRSLGLRWQVFKYAPTNTPIKTSSGVGAGKLLPPSGWSRFLSMAAPAGSVVAAPYCTASHIECEKSSPILNPGARPNTAHGKRYVVQIVELLHECERLQPQVSGA